MTIRTVYSAEPNFPATDQHPNAVRYHVGDWWVDAIGGEPSSDDIEAFLHPVFATSDPVPYLYATAQLTVADSDIASISITAKLAGAFRFDTGQYWVFFTDEQPDTNYMALAYDSGTVRAFVAEADKTTSYFVITTTDFTGTLADPDAINLEIKRVS